MPIANWSQCHHLVICRSPVPMLSFFEIGQIHSVSRTLSQFFALFLQKNKGGHLALAGTFPPVFLLATCFHASSLHQFLSPPRSTPSDECEVSCRHPAPRNEEPPIEQRGVLPKSGDTKSQLFLTTRPQGGLGYSSSIQQNWYSRPLASLF